MTETLAAEAYRKGRFPFKREPGCYEQWMLYEVGDAVEEAFVAGALWAYRHPRPRTPEATEVSVERAWENNR